MTATREASADPPVLARPPRFRGRRSFARYVRTMRVSSIATYSEDAFRQDALEWRILWRRHLILNRPEAVQHILLDNAANYVKSIVAQRLLEPGLGKGLLTSEGESWRRQRRIMAPAFDRRSLVSYAAVMAEAAQALLTRWADLPPRGALDVTAEMMRLTLIIIARAMFSTDADDVVPIIEKGVKRYQVEVRPGLFDLLEMPSWMTWFRDRSRVGIFKPLDEIVQRLIKRGTTGGAAHEDLLARLLAARDAETGLGMTHREVRDQVATIFMAGHETTALALTWTWYLLALHPAVEAQFHGEIDRVLAGRAPRFEDLALLPYTRMVLEESMRLYPPAHTITRRALADDEIGGRKIPRGTTVFIVPWVIHRHHALWDRPEIFDPERFTPEKAATRPRFAYLPFGGGPRICIGASFAMTEAMIILAMLGQRYRLRLAPGEPVEPVGLITLRPRHGLRMTIEPR